MKEKIIHAHMKVALEYAKLSTCNRLKVGCIIVKNDSVKSIGYNGTPPGWDNCCEDETGKTKPEVIHAEANAIAKLAKDQGDGINASVFITHAPCIDCAKQLASIGIKEVFYNKDYKDNKGIEFLEKCNIPIKKIQIGED